MSSAANQETRGMAGMLTAAENRPNRTKQASNGADVVLVEQLQEDPRGLQVRAFALVEDGVDSAVVVHKLEDVQLSRRQVADGGGHGHRQRQRAAAGGELPLQLAHLVELPQAFHQERLGRLLQLDGELLV